MSASPKNEKKSNSAAPRSTLENYINKTTLSRANDAFATATDSSQQTFKLAGTITIPSSSNNLPENFKENFQKNLAHSNAPINIELLGNGAIGFISTQNRLRITVSATNIIIQLGSNSDLTPIEIAKIGVAAAKAILQNSIQNKILLDAFSNNSLLESLQDLLHEQDLLTENISKQKESSPGSTHSKNPIDDTNKTRNKSLKFFSSPQPVSGKKK
jgi:hypothetical protein